MNAYMILAYDISDHEKYEQYAWEVIPFLKKHKAEILIADFGLTPLEGHAREVNNVLKFPSRETALGWYNDPEYQPLKEMRKKCTSNPVVVLSNEYGGE